MKIEDWNIEAMTGYHPITTFYSDFSIANKFGPDAIKNTYERSWSYAISNYKILTEFVMALNWQLWARSDNGQIVLAKVYNDLWDKAAAYAEKNLKKKELEYYYSTTD